MANSNRTTYSRRTAIASVIGTVVPFPGAQRPANNPSHQLTDWQVLADKIAGDFPPEPDLAMPCDRTVERPFDTMLEMWWARASAIEDYIDVPRIPCPEPVADILIEACWKCYRWIATTPIDSIKGARVKLRLIEHDLDGALPDWTLDAVDSLIADLDRMAGAA